MLGINSNNPYRLFFSFSLAGVISGLLLFVFSYSGVSIFWHRELMITLFLLPAATGFIFTAAPRFLVSTPTRVFEIWITGAIYLLLFVCFIFQWTFLFLTLKWLVLIWVAVFFCRRWWRRKTKNPYWPPFILVSFFSGILGVTTQLADIFFSLDPFWLRIGNSLYFDAMFWILLFGIGIKFFPMLTGAAPPVYQHGKSSLLTKGQYESNALWFSIAILCLAIFIIQFVISDTIGLWMRAILVSFIAYEGWGLLEKPMRKGFTTTFIKLFLWTIVAAHYLFPFYTAIIVHVYHVIFVIGFLAITMMVETRVLLSHEHRDIVVEQSSVWILSAFIMFYIAMIIRLTAVFVIGSYTNYLQYASMAALAGVFMVIVQIVKSFMAKNINIRSKT